MKWIDKALEIKKKKTEKGRVEERESGGGDSV